MTGLKSSIAKGLIAAACCALAIAAGVVFAVAAYLLSRSFIGHRRAAARARIHARMRTWILAAATAFAL